MKKRISVFDMVIYEEVLCVIVRDNESKRVSLVDKYGKILLTCESIEELNKREDVAKFVWKG